MFYLAYNASFVLDQTFFCTNQILNKIFNFKIKNWIYIRTKNSIRIWMGIEKKNLKGEC